jgi:hypothetical protein
VTFASTRKRSGRASGSRPLRVTCLEHLWVRREKAEVPYLVEGQIQHVQRPDRGGPRRLYGRARLLIIRPRNAVLAQLEHCADKGPSAGEFSRGRRQRQYYSQTGMKVRGSRNCRPPAYANTWLVARTCLGAPGNTTRPAWTRWRNPRRRRCGCSPADASMPRATACGAQIKALGSRSSHEACRNSGTTPVCRWENRCALKD